MADAGVSVRVDGLQAVLRALENVEAKVRKKTVKKALTAGARILVKAVKDKGRSFQVTGTLWKSVGQKVKVYQEGKAFATMVGPRSKFIRFAQARQGRKKTGRTLKRWATKYAHLVEYGTKRSRPKPFIRSAWATARGPAEAAIVKVLQQELA